MVGCENFLKVVLTVKMLGASNMQKPRLPNARVGHRRWVLMVVCLNAAAWKANSKQLADQRVALDPRISTSSLSVIFSCLVWDSVVNSRGCLHVP